MKNHVHEHPPSTEAPKSRRPRMVAMLAGATLVAIVAAGCQIPVDKWVPDSNGDGRISQAEIDRQSSVIATAVSQAVQNRRRQIQAHPFLVCVRAHESDSAGGYSAQNPYSSASGAYQFIDSTWRTVSARAGHPGYARAVHAPWYVQDAVAYHTINNGGRGHWSGTGC